MPLSTIVLREANPAGPAKMPPARRPIIILAATATPLDGDRVRAALAASPLTNLVHSVTGVQEMTDYLLRRGRYSVLARSRLPGLILLDEALLHNGGTAAVESVCRRPGMEQIALVLLRAEGREDAPLPEVPRFRQAISKPVTFDRLMESLTGLTSYRLERQDMNP